MQFSSFTFNKDSIKDNDTFTVHVSTRALQLKQVEKVATNCCGKCGAVLTDPRICKCCENMHSSNAVILKDNDGKLILVEEPQTDPKAPTTVFCVDCSGSMQGQRFNTVVAIMLKYIDELIAQNPSEKICVIGFGSEITIYGDCTHPAKVYTHFGKGQMDRIVSENSDIKSVSSAYQQLKENIPKMTINGLTAGVSALLIATKIASLTGGKVEFFTDGTSNKGIDEIEGIRDIKEIALKKHVMVNVYSFSNHQSFLLPYSPVAEQTGGQLQLLNNTYEENPEKIAPTLKAQILGFNVEYQTKTTDGITLVECPTNDIIIDTRDLTLTFKFEKVNELKKRDHFYVQVQIYYIDSKGRSVLYLLEKKCELSREIQPDNVRVILKQHANKIYVNLTQKKYEEAKNALKEFKSLSFNVSEDDKQAIKAVIAQIEKYMNSMNMSTGPSDDLMSFLSRLVGNNTSGFGI